MINSPHQPSQHVEHPPDAPGCVSYGALIVIGLWAMAVVGFGQLGTWFAAQYQIANGGEPAWYSAPISTTVQALLVAVPAMLFAALARMPGMRAVGWLWLFSSGVLFVFGLIGALPYTWAQSANVAQIVMSLGLLAIIWLVARLRGVRLPLGGAGKSVALALAVLIGLPFWALGALGSPLDTLLNLVAGLCMGVLVGALAGTFLLPELRSNAGGTALGVWALFVALLVIGGGFGFDGSKLLFMIVMPPLALAAMALVRRTDAALARAWLPLGLLFGSVAAAPLMFFDPDELTILLGNLGWGDVLQYALEAAALSFVLALIAGVVMFVVPRRATTPRMAVFGGLAAACVIAVALYALVGQPGFYGERLFVIMRAQADTSQAASIANRDERLQFVYHTLTEQADTTQANLRASLDRLGVNYQPYYLVNALEVNGGPLVRAYLMTRGDVAEVLDSPHLRPLPASLPVERGARASEPNTLQWNLTAIGADRVWNELHVTGKGIVIGQSDSGVDGSHPALAAGYRGHGGQNDYNWFDPWTGTSAPTDFGGHGTHTLGTALGRGGIGVAPDAQWFACVNLQRNLGDPALYLDCMQFMLAPFPQGGNPLKDGNPTLAAHVLNNSWGCPEIEGCDAEALAPATRALRDAGIFVVASAGNSGPECSTVTDPIAIYDSAFSVGAVDANGNVTSFSSRGPVTVDGSGRPKPDIAAPGDDVLSSLPGGTYGANSGTSMAGPHVVGVVALMWSANPRLIGDIPRTEQILRQTAQPYTGAQQPGCFSAENGVSNAYGYGIVDAYAAVQAALALR
ncbi:MAG TPA: S8 family serine peptidase [Roseiflexaceae bacterium]|nr:S8 family serine peptidase [Roseiflexaceae bacterium]